MTRLPAPRPCISCPYRRDVPAAVWAPEEYEKLPGYDGETWEQPPSVFDCHQQDGRLCAGWVACHDMEESFGLRVAVSTDRLTPEEYEAVLDYTTDVPVFASGLEAAQHGLREIETPTLEARLLVSKLERLAARRQRT